MAQSILTASSRNCLNSTDAFDAAMKDIKEQIRNFRQSIDYTTANGMVYGNDYHKVNVYVENERPVNIESVTHSVGYSNISQHYVNVTAIVSY